MLEENNTYYIFIKLIMYFCFKLAVQFETASLYMYVLHLKPYLLCENERSLVINSVLFII